MSALDRVRDRYRTSAEPVRENSNALDSEPAESAKSPSGGFGRSQDKQSGIHAPAETAISDPTGVRRIANRRSDARRAKLLAMMAEAPESRTHFYLTDDKADPDFVILALAIRHVGTCELSIPRERYDAFGLISTIEGAQSSACV